jgi:hypothetical protein
MVQAAMDKWLMAKELDVNVVDLANEKLAQYKDLIVVDIFCDNLVTKTIMLDCWINEEVEIQKCEE